MAPARYCDWIWLGQKGSGKERRQKIKVDARNEGEVIDFFVGKARFNLRNLVTGRSTEATMSWMRSDGTQAPISAHARASAAAGASLKAEETKKIGFFSPSGVGCKVCLLWKDSKKMRVKHLNPCTRYPEAHYCGGTCQKSQWKNLTRSIVASQVESKQVILHESMVSALDLNGPIVEMMRPDPKAERRLEIRLLRDSKKELSLKGERLQQLRPLLLAPGILANERSSVRAICVCCTPRERRA